MARLSSLLALLSCGLAAAAPSSHNALFRRDILAADIIAQIMPTSTSCAAANTGCATNVQAAPHFIEALYNYGLTHPAEIAGVLALTGFESGDLRYRSRADVAGQGTSNMQQITFNTKYAASFPELSAGLTAAGSDPNAILALVTPDKYNFGSGAWFLATQCSDDVRTQLQAGTDTGFAAYMTCVGVQATDERLAYWHRAQAAFSLSQ